MHEVVMPTLEATMTRGVLIKWHKSEGETVEGGERLVTIEGEKAVFDIDAPASGVLLKILYPEGSEAPVGSVLALIGEPGEAAPEKPTSLTPPEPTPALKPTAPQPTPARAERVPVSPAARRLAAEHGVDLSALRGSGPGGAIVREDVLRAVESARRAAGVETQALKPAVARVIPLAGIRRAVAERLSRSARSVVPAALMVEANFSPLLSLLQRLREAVQSGGAPVSLTALIVKAASKALGAFPELNASLEGGEIRVYRDVNIAVAVDTPQGLVAPVIAHADRKTVPEISAELAALADKASRGALTPKDVTGSTFTVSNLGPHGVDLFVPVINPPNAAILGVGRVVKKPAVGSDGEIKPFDIAVLSLVFDHRVTDGAPAARFLCEVERLVENPEELLR